MCLHSQGSSWNPFVPLTVLTRLSDDLLATTLPLRITHMPHTPHTCLSCSALSEERWEAVMLLICPGRARSASAVVLHSLHFYIILKNRTSAQTETITKVSISLTATTPQFNYHTIYSSPLSRKQGSKCQLTNRKPLSLLGVADRALQQVASIEFEMTCLPLRLCDRPVSQLLVTWLWTFRCQITFLSGQLFQQLEEIKTSKQKKKNKNKKTLNMWRVGTFLSPRTYQSKEGETSNTNENMNRI